VRRRKYTNVVEVMLLSTCNRTELVAVGEPSPRLNRSRANCAKMIVSRVPETDGHLYLYDGTDALQHIFRVVSSLDSLVVVREPQILGQFKDALNLPCRRAPLASFAQGRCARVAHGKASATRTQLVPGGSGYRFPTVALELAKQPECFGEMSGSQTVVACLGTRRDGKSCVCATIACGSRGCPRPDCRFAVRSTRACSFDQRLSNGPLEDAAYSNLTFAQPTLPSRQAKQATV